MSEDKILSKKLTHDALKQIGRNILCTRGFHESEIKEEYSIHAGNGKHYRIDIAAVKNEKVKIAIECGRLEHQKAVVLSELTELIHIPYCYTPLSASVSENYALKEEVISLKAKIQSLEEKRTPSFGDSIDIMLSEIAKEEGEDVEKVKKTLSKVLNREAPGWFLEKAPPKLLERLKELSKEHGVSYKDAASYFEKRILGKVSAL